jgi:hypothetical protein
MAVFYVKSNKNSIEVVNAKNQNVEAMLVGDRTAQEANGRFISMALSDQEPEVGVHCTIGPWVVEQDRQSSDFLIVSDTPDGKTTIAHMGRSSFADKVVEAMFMKPEHHVVESFKR